MSPHESPPTFGPGDVDAGAPVVTVVIPMHDAKRTIERTVASVLAQRGVSLELIVVDDGSQDECAAMVDAMHDPRVTLVRVGAASGTPSAPRNRGLGMARGTWTAFLDHDDLWAPDKLRRQVSAAIAAGAEWAYSSVIEFDDSGQVTGALPAPDASDLRAQMANANAIPGGGSNVLASTRFLRAVGGFDEALGLNEDWDLWLRLAAAGRAAAVEEFDVGYRKDTGNLTVAAVEGQIRQLKRIAAKHRDVDIATSDGWRWVADSQRRAGDRRGAARTYLALASRTRRGSDIARAAASVLPAGLRSKLTSRRAVREAPEWLTRSLGDEAATPRDA